MGSMGRYFPCKDIWFTHEGYGIVEVIEEDSVCMDLINKFEDSSAPFARFTHDQAVPQFLNLSRKVLCALLGPPA